MSKPIVILSSDNNPDYLFCLPIVAKSWELQGFDYCINVEGNKRIESIDMFVDFNNIDYFDHSRYNKLSPSSNAQIQRLYVRPLNEDATMLLGDADMFIGSDFLYKRFDRINVFGHDLTGREHIPICYVSMTGHQWEEIIGNNMSADIKKYGGPNQWCWDQDVLTAKLKAYGYDRINFIDRGIDPNNLNLPMGRWDRYGGFKRPAGIIHDVHLPRKPYSDEWFPKIVAMCNDLYPSTDWSWLQDYRREFLKEFSKERAENYMKLP